MKGLLSILVLIIPFGSSFQPFLLKQVFLPTSFPSWSTAALEKIKNPFFKESETKSTLNPTTPPPKPEIPSLSSRSDRMKMPSSSSSSSSSEPRIPVPPSATATPVGSASPNPAESFMSFIKTLVPSGLDSSLPLSPKPPMSAPSLGSLDVDNKFDMVQRIESVKCAAIGALSGSIAMAPVAFLHYFGNLPQFELMTDLGAIQGALFAIVYRYAIRRDFNPMLNQGVLGAFILVRTLPTIQTSPQCSALPLSCGAPIGYFNWDMLFQAITQGAESVALFGGAYLALEFAFSKGWITKFD